MPSGILKGRAHQTLAGEPELAFANIPLLREHHFLSCCSAKPFFTHSGYWDGLGSNFYGLDILEQSLLGHLDGPECPYPISGEERYGRAAG